MCCFHRQIQWWNFVLKLPISNGEKITAHSPILNIKSCQGLFSQFFAQFFRVNYVNYSKIPSRWIGHSTRIFDLLISPFDPFWSEASGATSILLKWFSSGINGGYPSHHPFRTMGFSMIKYCNIYLVCDTPIDGKHPFLSGWWFGCHFLFLDILGC